MKKLYAFAILMLSFSASLQATRPLRIWFAQKQSDGTSIMVTKAGNEHLNYYVTEDRVPLLRGANGDMCYASVSGDALVATTQMAHEKARRSTEEQKFVSKLMTNNQTTLVALETSRMHRNLRPNAKAGTADNGLGVYGQSYTGTVKSIGAPVIPVIMIDFPDLPFQNYTSEEKVSRLFNEEGYKDEKYTVGSVRDYFTDQSQGLFTPTFVVVAKVRASKNFASYGHGRGNSVTRTLVKEAVDSAEAKGVDFTTFYTDSKVPLVTIYYAGVGAHSSYEDDAEDHIWAHFSEAVTKTAKGATIQSYFVGNELYTEYTMNSNHELEVKERKTDGIGVFCHEFGHALGLPDFYYTLSNQTIADTLCTMDYWSVMDYGQYYANGYRPIGYNAYERSAMGWQRVTDLTPGTDDGYHTLNPFARENEDSASCYRIANPANDKEYFLLENRQPGKWYPTGMGAGMLALHIDYDATAWNGNRVNTLPNHQRVTYVPADGVKQGLANNGLFSDCANDVFAGKSGVTELSEETLGNWTTFFTPSDNSGTVAPLFDIAQNGGLITFCFNNKELVGISNVSTAPKTKSADGWHTLDGRKVAAPTRTGIYVNGNRKILVR